MKKKTINKITLVLVGMFLIPFLPMGGISEASAQITGVNLSSTELEENEDVVVSWWSGTYIEQPPGVSITYSNFETKLSVSFNGGAYTQIRIDTGTGSKSYTKTSLNLGTYKFKVEQYADTFVNYGRGCFYGYDVLVETKYSSTLTVTPPELPPEPPVIAEVTLSNNIPYTSQIVVISYSLSPADSGSYQDIRTSITISEYNTDTNQWGDFEPLPYTPSGSSFTSHNAGTFKFRVIVTADLYENVGIDRPAVTKDLVSEPKYAEITFMERPESPDTDGDGLSDFEESIDSFTDPDNPDSDYDGILDGEEFFAGLDGYTTDPNKEDSDEDGLSDYDEIFYYNTHPVSDNTDNDEFSDWDEIKVYHSDPLDRLDPFGDHFEYDTIGELPTGGWEIYQNFGNTNAAIVDPSQDFADHNGNIFEVSAGPEAGIRDEEIQVRKDVSFPDFRESIILCHFEMAVNIHPEQPPACNQWTGFYIDEIGFFEYIPENGGTFQWTSASLSAPQILMTGVEPHRFYTIDIILDFKTDKYIVLLDNFEIPIDIYVFNGYFIDYIAISTLQDNDEHILRGFYDNIKIDYGTSYTSEEIFPNQVIPLVQQRVYAPTIPGATVNYNIKSSSIISDKINIKVLINGELSWIPVGYELEVDITNTFTSTTSQAEDLVYGDEDILVGYKMKGEIKSGGYSYLGENVPRFNVAFAFNQDDNYIEGKFQLTPSEFKEEFGITAPDPMKLNQKNIQIHTFSSQSDYNDPDFGTNDQTEVKTAHTIILGTKGYNLAFQSEKVLGSALEVLLGYHVPNPGTGNIWYLRQEGLVDESINKAIYLSYCDNPN